MFSDRVLEDLCSSFSDSRRKKPSDQPSLFCSPLFFIRVKNVSDVEKTGKVKWLVMSVIEKKVDERFYPFHWKDETFAGG